MQTTMSFRAVRPATLFKSDLSSRQAARLPICRSQEQRKTDNAKTSSGGAPVDNAVFKQGGITTSDPVKIIEDVAQGNLEQAKADIKEQTDRSLKPRSAELQQAAEPGYMQAQDAFVFSGPAPELINGRLAMLGFTAGLAAEVVTHKTIFQQVAMAPLPVAATFLLITLASIVPLFGGVKDPNFKQNEIFTQEKELINGRAAMVGMAVIVAYEFIVGHSLF